MSQISLKPAPQARTETNNPVHPSDLLMHLVVASLAPMFLGVSGGDIGFARMAAIETVTSYRMRNHADLLAVAQIIAFGLAALGSLSLSLDDDVSVSVALRLRGNANALNRSAEQNRRALIDSLDDPAPPNVPDMQPVPMPTQPQPDVTPDADRTTAQAKTTAIWAAAMVNEATKLTATLANLPPEERLLAERRVASLTATAAALQAEPSPLGPGPA